VNDRLPPLCVNRRLVLPLLVATVTLTLTAPRLAAHKPVTSKYTYPEDVYPIVALHCGTCHAPERVAPMSLLTYDEARPWAESMRAELTSGHMPPWFADPAVTDLKDANTLSPRELDVLLTWITGGTPKGSAQHPPPTASVEKTASDGWRRGRPDLVIQLPAPFVLAADRVEETHDFVMPAKNDADRWIAAADLRPDNPSIVHDATIYLRRPDGSTDAVLAAWIPDAGTASPGHGVAFRWPAGEQLAVRVHYKKTWKLEGKPATDRSALGLYLLKTTPMREIRSVRLSAAGTLLGEDVQPLAFRTEGAPSSDSQLRVVAAIAGTRIPLIGFTTRAGWDQRYWLGRSRTLPKGTRLVVTTADGRPPSAEQVGCVWFEFAVKRG